MLTLLDEHGYCSIVACFAVSSIYRLVVQLPELFHFSRECSILFCLLPPAAFLSIQLYHNTLSAFTTPISLSSISSIYPLLTIPHLRSSILPLLPLISQYTNKENLMTTHPLPPPRTRALENHYTNTAQKLLQFAHILRANINTIHNAVATSSVTHILIPLLYYRERGY